ncbi:Gamma-soluble NSF attachment protein [Striga hermonthica]|uniref:Gamma-soluble NSF attachment protein n=1 Tax=Striga hermonthica TaxID=68872 RepID=A0A9N7NQI7_STRHE|nr:Gamma-soluble NSF attachment protein [Striga hermonthica]
MMYCAVENSTGASGYFNVKVAGHANMPNCFWLMECNVSKVVIPLSGSPKSPTQLKKLVGEADLRTKLSLTRWTADWTNATFLYEQAGSSQGALDALTKGARALKDKSPDEAIQLYVVACDLLEEDENVQMTFDLYRAAVGVYVKLEKYTDAATFPLRWAVAADKSMLESWVCTFIFLKKNSKICAARVGLLTLGVLEIEILL